MRQEQSRRKSPAARILSLALALCMIAAFVPAITLTAGAAEPSYTPSDLIGFATLRDDGYSFIGDTTSSYTLAADTAYAWNDTVANSTNWEGWSGSGSLYSLDGETLFWDVKVGSVYPNDKVQEGTKNTDFMVISWKSSGIDNWEDYGIIDSSGTIIDTFRYRAGHTEGLNYTWANTGSGAGFTDSSAQYYTYDVTYSGSYGLTAADTTYYVVYENDEENNQYTASYYYQGPLESSTTWISTKTYSGATFSGLSEIQVGKMSWYERIYNLEIYAGNYPSADDPTFTVTVNYEYDGVPYCTEELSGYTGVTVTSTGHTTTLEDGTKLVWNSKSYTVGSENTEKVQTPYSVGGLIAYYNFSDEDAAADALGNFKGTNHGVEVKNGIGTFEGGTGSGVDNIQMPDSLMQALDGNFTISMWVKQDTNYTRNDKAIAFFDFTSKNQNDFSRLFWEQKSTTTTLQERGNKSGNRVIMTNTASSAMKGVWALITVSFDFTGGTATAYVNGEKLDLAYNTTDGKSSWTTANTPANIYSTGSSGSGYPSFGANVWALNDTNTTDNPGFCGEMASIKIYNYAVTADEAATLNLDSYKTLKISYQDADGVNLSEATEVTTTEVIYFSDEAEFEVPATLTYDSAQYKIQPDENMTVSDDGTYYTVKASGETYTVNYTKGETVYNASVNITAGENGSVVHTITDENVAGEHTIDVPAETFLFEGKIYTVEATTKTLTADDNVANVVAEVTQEYAMTSVTTTYESSAHSVNGYAGAAGDSDITQKDDDGNALAGDNVNTLLSWRKVQEKFPLPETFEDGQVAILHVATAGMYKNNGSSTSEAKIRLRATANGASAYTTTLSIDGSIDQEMFDDAVYLTADVTELVKAAKAAGETELSIEFETAKGAVYFVGVSNALYSGANAGDASYIEILDATDENVVAVTLPEGATITENGGSREANDNNVVYIAKDSYFVLYEGSTAVDVVVDGVVNSAKTQLETATIAGETGAINIGKTALEYLAGEGGEGVATLTYYTTDASVTYGARTFYYDGAIYDAEEEVVTSGDTSAQLPAEKRDVITPDLDGFFTPNYDDNNTVEYYVYETDSNMIYLTGYESKNPFGLSDEFFDTANPNNVAIDTDVSKTRVGYLEFTAPEGYSTSDSLVLTLNISELNTNVVGVKAAAVPVSVTLTEEGNGAGTGCTLDSLAYSVGSKVYYSNDYITSDSEQVTIDLTGIEADSEGKIKVILAVPVGKIKFANMEETEFGGTYEGQTAYLTYTKDGAKTATVTITAGDKTVATYETSVAAGTKTVTLPSSYGIIYNGSDGKYYIDRAQDVTLGDDYTATLKATQTGNVYTAVIASVTTSDGITYNPNTVYYGNLIDSGEYTGIDNFGAFNWGTGDSAYTGRVGVAVLDKPAPDKTQFYYLSGTCVRNTNDSINVRIYAIDYDTYMAIEDMSELATYINDENETYLVGTVGANDATGKIQLDADIIDAIETDKVVLLGAASNGLYGLAGEGLAITTEEKSLGVELYAGAQIRVGEGFNDDPESDNYQGLLGDSGLRFIAEVTTGNTIAAEADYIDVTSDDSSTTTVKNIGIAIFDGEFGTEEITAAKAKEKFENEDPVQMITATKYQVEDTVFTAAITNINVLNYNRIYVAVPYVVVTNASTGVTKTYYDWDEAVARTPYQVAAGILADESLIDEYKESETVQETLINVLNVYTNKTGARVTIAKDSDGYTVTAVTYANGATAFFEITTEVEDKSGNYVFTLSPKSGTSAEFYNYARDYFRIKNASADAFVKAVEGASVELVGDSLVITIPASTTDSGTETETE